MKNLSVLNTHCSLTQPSHFSGFFRHMRVFAIAVLVAGFILPSVAYACTGPAGAEGEMVYDSTHKAMVFCDGTNWVSMGGGGGGTDTLAGLGCGTTEIPEYDGTDWQCISTPGGGGASVWLDNGPGGPAEIYYNGGNIGIGTNDPPTELYVHSAGVSESIVSTAGDAASEQATLGLLTSSDGVNTYAAGTKGWQIYARGNTYGGGNENDLGVGYWNGSAWINPLYIDSLTGYVGIGTANPAYMAHVVGGLGVSSTNTSLFLEFSPVFTGSGNAANENKFRLMSTGLSDSTQGYKFSWRNDDSTPRIDTLLFHKNGYIGIGKTPSTALDVNGTAKATLFEGSGASLTALNATNLGSGTVPVGRLGASGTPSATTYLRGDNTWQTPSGGGSGVNLQEFTSSGTWTKPASGTFAEIECWGGGGGGGRGSAKGTGGGGGGYNQVKKLLSALGATETVTVGGGGAGATSATGTVGSNTTFGSHLTAYGGGPGTSCGGGSTCSGGGGGGPLGAGANLTPGLPLIPLQHTYDTEGNYAGSDFYAEGGRGSTTGYSDPESNSPWSHGGGGGGSNGTVGSSQHGGAANFGGGGGASVIGSVTNRQGGLSLKGGNGGNANASGVAGGAGTQPGGGGAGGLNANGGAGAAGMCIVTVY